MICNTLLLSMSTENCLLAFGRSLPVWCLGAVLGWIGIPLMNANLDVVFRQYIPVEMQGRVYSARNTLQFFTIPIGYVAGGYLVDRVFEPFNGVAGDGKRFDHAFRFWKGLRCGVPVCHPVACGFDDLSCVHARSSYLDAGRGIRKKGPMVGNARFPTIGPFLHSCLFIAKRRRSPETDPLIPHPATDSTVHRRAGAPLCRR